MKKFRIKLISKTVDESGKSFVSVLIGDNCYRVEVLKSDYDQVLEK